MTTTGKRRVLAVVSHFKKTHPPYLLALSRCVDLRVAWSEEVNPGSVKEAIDAGLSMVELWNPPVFPNGASLWKRVVQRGRRFLSGDPAGVDDLSRTRLGALLREWRPDVVHVMYYYHEKLTLLVRELADPKTPVIFECRDPITTLMNAAPGSAVWNQEGAAVRAADGHILVSSALRRYLEHAHGVDLGSTTLIVPHSFSRATAGPLSEKHSSRDGRVHLALVGTADPAPGHGRWYGDIIRRLVSLGLVVHSHFWESPDQPLEAYRSLAATLPDYHFHPTVSFRVGTALSELTSRYDLMGVFHELQARWHNESATLAVCMPTKAVSGWMHGAIPVVTFPHYRGLTDLIEAHGTGFVIQKWEDLKAIAADRDAIRRATEKCLAMRLTFTHEHQAERIAQFYEATVSRLTHR